MQKEDLDTAKKEKKKKRKKRSSLIKGMLVLLFYVKIFLLFPVKRFRVSFLSCLRKRNSVILRFIYIYIYIYIYITVNSQT